MIIGHMYVQQSMPNYFTGFYQAADSVQLATRNINSLTYDAISSVNSNKTPFFILLKNYICFISEA